MSFENPDAKRLQEIKFIICTDFKKLKVSDLVWLICKAEILQARVEFLEEFYKKELKESKFDDFYQKFIKERKP